jgi:hypothetical protein
VPNLVSLVRQGVQCKRFFIISSVRGATH